MTLSTLEGITLSRTNCAHPRGPVLYEPCIVIVCQGRKRVYLGESVYVFDAQQYLVLSVPLPLESETEASEAEPLLAVKLRIDLPVVAELVMALDQPRPVPVAGQRSLAERTQPAGIASTPLSDKMSDALLRLLEVLTVPADAAILGPAIVRELLFYVLTGPQGGAIRASLTLQSQFGKIGKALRRIHAEFALPIDVGTLASEAGMSVAAFHASFKAVTHTSPIQYLKTTRLHKARLLMVQDGVNAATASSRVGYESTSQFSREFKRFFGRSPLQEAAHMKTALLEMPAEDTSRYATVQ
jgi:AraC-like DNA-binding protein